MSHPLWYIRHMIMNKVTILRNDEETSCRVSMNGFASEHKCKMHGFDHEGHESLTIDIEDVGEFISYDDGETWGDM